MELHYLSDLAESQGHQTAAAELLHWLEPGNAHPYARTLEIHSFLSTGPPEEKFLKKWKSLIKSLEELPTREKQFLDAVQVGKRAFQAEEWSNAQEIFQIALSLHRPDYQMSREELERKLSQTSTALEMQQLIQSGNDAYLAKSWKDARGYFQEVLEIHEPDLGVDKTELSQVIERCRKGQQYVLMVHQARNAVKIGAPQDGLKIYRKALSHYHTDFEPAAEVLMEEVKQVEADIEAAAQEKVEKAPFWGQSRVRIPLVILLLAGVGLMAGYYFFHETPSQQSAHPSVQRVSQPIDSDGRSANEEAWAKFNASTETGMASFEAQDSEEITKTSVEADQPLHSATANRQITVEYPPAEQGNSAVNEPMPDAPDGLSHQAAATSDMEQVVSSKAAPMPDPTPATDTRVESTLMPETDEAPSFRTAETSAKKSSVGSAPIPIAEVMPSFPGGEKAMAAYLSERLQYPQLARENRIQGTVYLQMVIEADGSITHVKLARGIGYGCDAEAMRIVRNMPRWNPGLQDGEPVPVIYTIPIAFKIH